MKIKIRSYYTKRKEEMIRLRTDEHWTLEEIARKFEISRERVRQILGELTKTTRSSKLKRLIENSSENLTNRQIAETYNCSMGTVAHYRRNVRHALENSKMRDGSMWEEEVSKRLSRNHIPNKLMPYRHKFDILTDSGVRIEVLSANTPASAPSMRNVSPCWSFSVRNDRRPHNFCDFFILYIKPEDVIFVVPSYVLAGKNQIRMCYPTRKPTMRKLAQYEDAYHLIREFERDTMSSPHSSTGQSSDLLSQRL